MIAACLSHQRLPAVTAEDQAGKRKHLLFIGRGAGIPAHQILYNVEQDAVDQRLMGIFYANPVLFLHWLTYLYLVVRRCLLALRQNSHIYLVGQNPCDRLCCPSRLCIDLERGLKPAAKTLFVFHRRENPLLVQSICNPVLAHAVDFHAEYILYHLSGICIDNKLVMIVRVFQIAIAGKGTNELPFFSLDLQMASDFDRQVSAIRVVDQVLERHHNVMCRICIQAVIVVVDSDKPDAQHGKQLFQVSPYLNIVPSESGQVFYDDTVDHALFHVLQHGLKCRTVKIGSRISIIFSNGYDLDFRPGFQIFQNQVFLIGDAVAFDFGACDHITVFLR